MYVEDLEKNRPELVLIEDSQEIEEIVKYCLPQEKVKDALESIGCLFVEVLDGDYGDIFLCEYSVPWLTAPVYDLRSYFQ